MEKWYMLTNLFISSFLCISVSLEYQNKQVHICVNFRTIMKNWKKLTFCKQVVAQLLVSVTVFSFSQQCSCKFFCYRLRLCYILWDSGSTIWIGLISAITFLLFIVILRLPLNLKWVLNDIFVVFLIRQIFVLLCFVI